MDDHNLQNFRSLTLERLIKNMKSSESAKLLAASGGDTVKLLQISPNAESRCVVAYPPSPGFSVNSVKWNHNNMVLASASDDGKISFWKRNGTRLWEAPCKDDGGGNTESISSINFCNKGSRYLCSGGTGQVVRIWDLQSKRCIKWLKGHSDTITSVMCNCKDEHIASISCKGDLIVHSLVSGAKVAEVKDPEGQVLVALDYSRISRHLLVTAGDEGSVHLWDTTGHNPKVSWSKQHSAPASGVSFSPPNDKIIASVGLDMKLYTFDTGSKKPSSCIHHEAPFSSLAYSDDGLTLVAGTTTGQVVLYDTRGKPQPLSVLQAYENSEAISSLCWQRSKPVSFNERSCTDEMIPLAGDVGEPTILPDPHPSRNPSHGPSSKGFISSLSASSATSSPASEEQPRGSNLLVNRTLAKLHLPLSNVKDDMEVFSPVVDVQPFTPTFDKLWDNHEGAEKDGDRNPGFLLPSRRFGLSEEAGSDENPIFNLSSTSASKQVGIPSSTSSKSTSNPALARSNALSPSTPRKPWGGERALEKFIHRRQSTKMPSRFAKSPTTSPMGLMPSSNPNVTSLHGKDTSPHAETSLLGSSESSLSAIRTKGTETVDSAAASSPRLFSSYAERIFGATSSLPVGSPKSKKTGTETREDILNNLLSISQPSIPRSLTTSNGGETQLQKTPLQSDSKKGTSYIDEETVASLRESIHADMQNLHLEILRQFHMQEMGMSSVLRLILENQAEIMQEIQSLREEVQHFHHLL